MTDENLAAEQDITAQQDSAAQQDPAGLQDDPSAPEPAAPRDSGASEDLAAERERLLDGWDEASKGWGRQASRLQEAAEPVSKWMLDGVQVRRGERVLELAAGPGDTGFIAARKIRPEGTLICSDASAGMLDLARARASEQGITNVEFKQLQLEWIDLPTADVDVALCRWGIMLILDPAAALRECRRVLKPGGRLAVAVWNDAGANPWATIIQDALVELGHVPSPPADGPGMFSLAAPGKLTELLQEAGFLDIEVESVPIVRHYADVLDWVGETLDLSRTFGAVWPSLSKDERTQLRRIITEDAAKYTDGNGAIALPGSSLVAAASA